MTDTNQEPLRFNYKFKFDNGEIREFPITLSPLNLKIITDQKEPFPEWAKLEYQKCGNCPLNEKDNPYCPIAVNLAGPLEYFKTANATQKVDVTVESPQRTYFKSCDLRTAISSFLGIYMVTSGCPVMNKLRPTVMLHLPFASVQETIYRMSAMYILAQYFLYKKNQTPDWSMDGLPNLYDDINLVNFGFMQRLKLLCNDNAASSAIIALDFLGQNTASTLKGEMNKRLLDEIENLFNAYNDER